jgi:hypothetical protein
MSQLALGPILSSQYQINLFWIQQCHLTIGASYSSRSTHFLMPPQVLFSAVACAILAPWFSAFSGVGSAVSIYPYIISF